MSDTVDTEAVPAAMPAALPAVGDLTIHTAAAQRETLLLLASADDAPTLVLDLSHTEEFDSAGVQLLLALRRTLAASGRALQLDQAGAAVTAVLATYQLDPRSLAACGPQQP